MNTFKQLLAKPKIAIPASIIIVALLTVFAYGRIGVAPAVPSTVGLSSSQSAVVSGGNVSLSFAKSGRVESVLVKEGDAVRAGQVLAKLSAPDAEGAVAQAKGALDLAQAQYASLNSQYKTAKEQQDLMVANAYKTMVSGSLEGVPSHQDQNTPIISGTYACGTEGSYRLKPYSSGDSDSGYSLAVSGLENVIIPVKYDNAVPLGTCGLEIKFNHVNSFDSSTTWTISVPNTKGSAYLANKNAYDLAVANRDKVLADLETNIGTNTTNSVAKAQIDAAQGAYQAALGAYQNNVIVAPVAGTVTFVDPDLKAGQSAVSGKSVISINQ